MRTDTTMVHNGIHLVLFFTLQHLGGRRGLHCTIPSVALQLRYMEHVMYLPSSW
jgi:hypothetical protein